MVACTTVPGHAAAAAARRASKRAGPAACCVSVQSVQPPAGIYKADSISPSMAGMYTQSIQLWSVHQGGQSRVLSRVSKSSHVEHNGARGLLLRLEDEVLRLLSSAYSELGRETNSRGSKPTNHQQRAVLLFIIGSLLIHQFRSKIHHFLHVAIYCTTLILVQLGDKRLECCAMLVPVLCNHAASAREADCFHPGLSLCLCLKRSGGGGGGGWCAGTGEGWQNRTRAKDCRREGQR